jgi:uroporphyrinogen decarboxylase
MTPRELVIRTLNQQPADRVPRDRWDAPGLVADRPDDLAEADLRFPGDIDRFGPKSGSGKHGPSKSRRAGQHADAWGCTWRRTSRGTDELVHSPLADPGKIDQYQPPAEPAARARITNANRLCEASSRFVLASTEVRPFDRLLWLRGPQAALADLADGAKRGRDLLRMLHEVNCRELELWAESDVDGVLLCDDWANEDGLLLDTKVWRSLIRPLYRDYCKILHRRDKFVFFHSAGRINQMFGQLVQLGMDAIHSPFLAADVEPLAKRYRGKVTFWIEPDPQHIGVSSTPHEVREATLQVRRTLDYGSGGVIALGRFDADLPLANLAALYEQWLVALPMHAA